MNVAHILKKAALIGLLCGASAVNASTIDFEGVAPDKGSLNHNATPYTQNGYTLSSSISVGYHNDIYGALSGRNTNGTAVFGWCGMACGDVTLTLAGSTAFSLASIDFGGLNDYDTGGLKITGLFADGSSVSDTFSIASLWSTHNFSGFNNLKALQITVLTSFSPAMDNIVVANDVVSRNDVVAAAVVPEPGSIALLGIGAAVLGCIARRRKTDRAPISI